MRNYKACGEDQVFAETWKYAGNTSQTSLNLILEKIWIIEQWTSALINPLKKGDKRMGFSVAFWQVSRP